MSPAVTSQPGSLRVLAASCVLTIAVLHAALTPPHLNRQLYVGILFAIGTAVLLAAFAGMLARRSSPLSWWLAGLVIVGDVRGVPCQPHSRAALLR